MINSFLQKRLSGHQRSIKAKKNILAAFLLKGISILINLLLVPLTINYLNPTNYGIWITLTSVIAWFNFFDVGLGNGLRNKFATAKAEGKNELAKTYISTTYAIISLISLSLFIVFFIVNQFLDWRKILNTSTNIVEIEKLIYIVFSVFCFQFIVKLINVIFIADQRPALNSVINTVGSIISLIVVFILTKTTNGSLLYLGASFSLINLLIPLFAGIWFFNTSYKHYKPSFKYINFSYFNELMSLGFRFFIMQGAALIIFMTDNMIITQVSGPEHVTPYNIAYKYFGIITVIFTIVTTPLWSASTEAYIKQDFEWMKNTIKKMIFLWLGFIAITGGMLAVSDYAYNLWVGDMVEIPFSLSLMMAIYVSSASIVMIFANFLSGIGRIQLSLYHSVFVGILNIPLSIYFAKNLEMGSTGVILATCCGVFISMIFQPIQCYKILNGTANSLWNK